MMTTVLLALLAGGEPAESIRAPEARITGGVVAPAALPAGTNALYALVGAPELGVGYRQGFGPMEFEARGLFNLFEISALVEVGVKLELLHIDRLRLAPTLALALKLDSGATYFDKMNFAYVGLRPRLGLNASYDFTETISGVASVEIPWAVALTTQGFQVTPLLGAGGEFHLGRSLSLLISAHGGFDVTREPLGMTQYRPAWALRLGVGYRLF